MSEAAQACFGTPQWTAGKVVPRVSTEFDVADAAAVEEAGGELARAGYELLPPARSEPPARVAGARLPHDRYKQLSARLEDGFASA